MKIRAAILERLATPQAETRFGEPYLPREIAAETSCRLHQVYEAIWGLVGDGLIYLDPAGQSGAGGMSNWHWRLSTVGLQAASGGAWEPRDPAGYLRRLKHRAPDLDEAALVYVREALSAFNARCYLATSVMLGVAAEHVFGRLAGAFVAAHDDEAEALKKLLSNPATTYYRRFTEFRKRLEPKRGSLPDGLADSLTLDAVADLLRVTRNAAGHPTGEMIDEDTAYTHLQMAGRYLAKMTELAGLFEKQAATLDHQPLT